MLETIRNHLHYWPLAIVAVVAWMLGWSIDYHKRQTTSLSPHLTLAERVLVERSAFSLAGGDGGFIALPIPSRRERVVFQRILRDGVSVWSAGEMGRHDFYHPVKIFASPDEQLVVLQWATLVIHDLASGKGIEVRDPDRMSERHFEYDVAFFGWAPDSRAVYVFSDQLDLQEVDEVWVRFIWKVDVVDGSATLDRQCEQRFAFDPDRGPDWRLTSCAESR